MTTAQKLLAQKLLEGYYLVPSGPHWFRLRSPDYIIIRKISSKSFQLFKPLLRKKKNFYFINKNEVRRLHGGSYIKQSYKQKKAATAI